jgi:hypothetical protein
MASNNYNPYNYPYQQSAAQQCPAYQTAPPANNASQPSRQYQQPSTTQGNGYISYQGPSYGAQSSGYTGSTQDTSWNGSSYGGNQETTRGAAEALRNMSNTNYTPTPANNATSQTTRYSSGTSNSPRMQPQQTHAAHATKCKHEPRTATSQPRAALGRDRSRLSFAQSADNLQPATAALCESCAKPLQHQFFRSGCFYAERASDGCCSSTIH